MLELLLLVNESNKFDRTQCAYFAFLRAHVCVRTRSASRVLISWLLLPNELQAACTGRDLDLILLLLLLFIMKTVLEVHVI